MPQSAAGQGLRNKKESGNGAIRIGSVSGSGKKLVE